MDSSIFYRQYVSLHGNHLFMPHLQLFKSEELQVLLSQRTGETKLGETVNLAMGNNWDAAIQSFEGKFVIIGLPEDIGVRANGGIGGAQTVWLPFLKSFINIQETKQLGGNDFLILGAVNFDDWLGICEDASIE